jgi:hypothetical protein
MRAHETRTATNRLLSRADLGMNLLRKDAAEGMSDAEQNRIHIDILMDLQEQLTEQIDAMVHQLREDGASWAQVAHKIGGTRQAAQQKYGKKPSKNIDALQLSDPIFDPLFLTAQVES